MTPEPEHIPGFTDDPVLRLILDGRADSLHDAEELYLDASLADIVRLIAGPLDDEALRRPLMRLLASHGGRGWEDSLL